MYLAKELPPHNKEAKKPLFAPSELYSKSIMVLESRHGCWIRKKDYSDSQGQPKKLNIKKSDSESNRLKPVISSTGSFENSNLHPETESESDAI